MKIMACCLFQDEHGAYQEPAAGADSDHPNGVSGPSPSAALHHPAGPKKRRHRLARQEKDKDQHVGAESGQKDRTGIVCIWLCSDLF